VKSKPISVQVLGEKIMLRREKGQVYALHDRCPHRGVPLSHPMATQEFSGTWSCCYHGWTFDLASGELVAAITDGPDSPIAGKCRVRTYPVEERLGLVWLYIGDNPEPPHVETDIPSELLREDTAEAEAAPHTGHDSHPPNHSPARLMAGGARRVRTHRSRQGL
jgi:phenylpropionate dioxygenase-like ring-hydroxylating dioxygenase large terminal subunit